MTASPVTIRAALDRAGLRPEGSGKLVATGWESQIWSCDTEGGPVAVRVYARGVNGRTAAVEGSILRRLEMAAYPVPIVFHVDSDTDALGSPFLVMDFIDGKDLWSSTDDPGRAIEITADLMAELHGIDPAVFTAHGDVPPADEWFIAGRNRIVETFPGFTDVAGWVTECLSRISLEAAPCHLDMHPGNMIMDPDGHTWVVDWTSFALTDPRFDVAWSRLLLEMYRPEGLGDKLVERYRRRAPYVDESAFEVAAAIRRLSDFLWFMTPEARDAVQDQGEIRSHRPEMRVPERWIAERTGLYVAEVEAMLDGL